MTNEGVPLLVVDDDDDLRSLLAEVLEDDGYAVTTAADGAEALRILRSTTARPRLVLLDLVMPLLDGREVCDAMQADADLRDIPVLLLTGDPTGDTLDLGRRTVGLVHKPIDLDRLLASVDRAWRR